MGIMWDVSLETIAAVTHIMYGDSMCPMNCSGHGECWEGTCVCVVQFQGGDCKDYNNAYFIAFGSVFYFMCFVAIIQLILCIISEQQRSKTKSLSAACRITTQKTLYVMVILATFSRGLYFTLLKYIPHHWAANLLSMYYPFLLSCCSLCVCFWAEAFHISNKDYARPGSLSKSLVYFLVFNGFLYTALIAQFIASELYPETVFLLKVFHGFFASLIFIEVILFLAYGVEVYFKVKGAFTNASTSLDPRTLHLSRFGLIFQGILQILTAFFLMMSVTEAKWNENIPLQQRNSYIIVFRVVELGMVMWYPCVLWNCKSPEKLWILNPRRILRDRTDEEHVTPVHSIQTEKREGTSLLNCRKRQENLHTPGDYQSTQHSRNRTSTDPDCWICYDRDNPALGPLIRPCTCKGDMAFVHHECLRRWMLESEDSPEVVTCKVCKNRYDLWQGKVHLYQGLSTRDTMLCLLTCSTMCAGPGAVYALLQAYPSSTINIVTIGLCVLLEMTCLRYLGYTLSRAYKRAKIFSLRILGKNSTSVIMENEAATPDAAAAQQTETIACSGDGSTSDCEHGEESMRGGAEGGGIESGKAQLEEMEHPGGSRKEGKCKVHDVSFRMDPKMMSAVSVEHHTCGSVST